MERYENYGTIHFFQHFDSLADVDKVVPEYTSDEELQAITMNIGDVFASVNYKYKILQSI